MKKWLEKMDWIYVIVPLALLGTFWVIAAFTGQWPWQSNPYNSYALQTDSWLKGRLDLGQDYPYLNCHYPEIFCKFSAVSFLCTDTVCCPVCYKYTGPFDCSFGYYCRMCVRD